MRKIFYMVIFAVIVLIGISINNITNKSTETSKFYNLDYKDYDDLIIKCGNKDEKFIALTFDDGPDEVFTPQILDILKKYNVKATFFVIGQKVEYNKNIVKRQFDEGHEIGNHTFSHINVSKNGFKKIEKEIIDTQNAIKNVTGVYTKVFRPPYRAISKDMCEIIKQNDMKIVLWSYVDAKDWSSPGVNNIITSIEDGIQNGCIILLHDYNKIRTPKSQTIEALEIMIPALLQKGYKFITITELIEHLGQSDLNQETAN